MSLSALIRSMAAAGATPEAIAIAVEAIEAAQGAVADQRAAARDRKRRQRERAKEQDNTATVTGQSRDEAVTVTANPSLSPSPLSSPQTPQQTPRPHTHPYGDTPRACEADPFPRPGWAEPQVWRDLKANRKAKRLPCTPTAYAKLLRDIDKLVDDDWPPGRLLEAIVARGWAAAYDPREERKSTNDRQPARNDRCTDPWLIAAHESECERRADAGPVDWD